MLIQYKPKITIKTLSFYYLSPSMFPSGLSAASLTNIISRPPKATMSDTLFFIDRDGDQPLSVESKLRASGKAKRNRKKTAPKDSNIESCDNETAQLVADATPESSGDNPPSHTETVRPRRRNKSSNAVWYDDDDDEQQVDLLYQPRRKKLREDLEEGTVSVAEYTGRLRRMHQDKLSSRGLGGWAQLLKGKNPDQRENVHFENDVGNSCCEDADGAGDDNDVDSRTVFQDVKKLMRTSSTAAAPAEKKQLANGTGRALGPGVLDLRVVTDANIEERNAAEARCVDFHPTGRIIMTAGLDKTVRLFAVDGKQNAKLQSIHLRNFPIHSAQFVNAGEEIVATGRRRYFHAVNLQTGRVTQINTLSRLEERSWEHMKASHDGSKMAFMGQHGRVVVMCAKSKRNIGQLRLNGHIADVAFSHKADGEDELYTCSTDGTVYLWDLRTMKCIDKHRDEGAVHSTCLAAANGYYGVGSDSGVVNLYPEGTLRRGQLAEGVDLRTEQPAKRLFNLRTRIDNIAFNTDGQLMAFASHEKKGAVRIVHTASMSVFSNWPTARSSISSCICSLTFSPSSGFLAVGESSGRVRLLRLNAYPVC